MRAILILSAVVTQSLLALPPDAEALQAKRDAKVIEINTVYAQELEKLQKKHMANGNLAGANEIEKEIAIATPDPFASEIPKLNGKWLVNGKYIRTFFGNTMVEENGSKHPCNFENCTITIYWGNLWEKLAYDPKSPDFMEGINYLGEKYYYRRMR